MSDYPLLPVLRLLRFPNLVVVALTQYLVYYRVMLPSFEVAGISGVLTPWKFVELVLATVAITASGYLINDLQDEAIDEVNRPGTNPVALLGRDAVMWTYGMMLLGGFLVSQLLAYRLGERHLLWIFPLAIGVLSVYSSNVKKLPLLGNFLVAAFCAGVPGILLLAERSAVTKLLELNPDLGFGVLKVCLLFMVYAFVLTMLRELVKDLEDLAGDRMAGRRTIPVMIGQRNSRRLGVAVGLIAILALAVPYANGWPGFLRPAPVGLVVLLSAALVVLIIRLVRARTPKEYGRLSLGLKFFLLGGLGLLLLFQPV